MRNTEFAEIPFEIGWWVIRTTEANADFRNHDINTKKETKSQTPDAV